jgi:glutathione S-transferase
MELVTWLNDYLLYRTFVVSNHVTLADIVCFAKVRETLSIIAEVEKFKLINVYRWANHVQNLAGLREHIPHKVALPDKRAARILKKADAVIEEVKKPVKSAAPEEEKKQQPRK